MVSSLTPELRWVGPTDERYLVQVWEGESPPEKVILHRWTRGPQMVVPDHLLKWDRVYGWSVVLLDPESRQTGEPVLESRFATNRFAQSAGLRVTPATLRIRPDRVTALYPVSIRVPPDEEVIIELPEVLSVAGRRRIRVVGSVDFTAVVTVALSYVSRDPDGDELGRIAVLAGSGGRVDISVRYDTEYSGRWLRSVSAGFDPTLDAPAFANYTEGWLASATNGTCLGMVLGAHAAYRSYQDCQLREGRDCRRLRWLSLNDPAAWRDRMSFLHTSNLDPAQWGTAVQQSLGASRNRHLTEQVVDHLVQGSPVPLAIVGSREMQAQGNGHAVLAFAVHEFESGSLVFVYDPNRLYDRDGALGLALFIQRGGQVRAIHPDRTESVVAFTMPDSPLLRQLAGLFSRPYAEVDRQMDRLWQLMRQ
jgi:hypothetical protein